MRTVRTFAGALLLGSASALLACCSVGYDGLPSTPGDASNIPAGTTTPRFSILVSGEVGDGTPQKGKPELEPILYLVNDTDESLVVRNLDVPTAPAVIMAPKSRFVANLGGEFFGKPENRVKRNKEIRRSHGIPLAIFDEAGEERGRILYTPKYLYSGNLDWTCLSRVAEPLLTVDSWTVIQSPPCKPNRFAP